MTYFFRTWTVLLLTAVSLLLTTFACSEKKDPEPTTGSLEGTISPAGAVTKVTAKTPAGLTFLATPTTSGGFTLTDLAPGVYTLSFAPAPGYLAPTERSITIVAGQKAAVGTVEASSDGTIRSGTMNWTTDGVTYTTTSITGQIDEQAHTLSILGTATTGNKRDQLDLYLGSFYGNATYSLGGYNGGPAYGSATLTRIDGGIRTGLFYAGAGGTLTISSYNAALGTINGSFGFVGTDPNTYPQQSVTITNGTFTLRF